MRRVLFIGITYYDFKKNKPSHLRAKFEGLSGSIKAYVLARGMPHHKKIWGTDFYLLPNRFIFWSYAFRLAFWLCLTKKIDVIVAQSPLLEGFIGALLKKILRKELIIEVHGDWVKGPFLSKKRWFKGLQKAVIPWLARFSLKSADKIRAISTYTRDQALKIAPEKPSFVFPTFTDINSFLEEKNISQGNFILFVGGLEEVKGIDILIKSFAEISQKFSDFKLVLVGDGSQKQAYKSQAADLNLTEKVVFKGKFSLKETKNIMKDCYCLVLPSRSEGLGRVLIEAMALSKPVVGSRVGGIPDLIKDNQNGFLFTAGSTGELAQKIKALLKDSNRAREMGQVGRDFIEQKFSNKSYINNYLAMINSSILQ